jgi:putative inorganic carbon (HCO3(-)) transporter
VYEPHRQRYPVAIAAVPALIAWGTLAFGAVYPWAYVPLMIAASCIGVAGLSRSTPRSKFPAGFAIALAVVAAAICVQLVPLSSAALAALSPDADRVLRIVDLRYAADAANDTATHAVSIDPARTLRALGFFVSCSLLILGIAQSLNRDALRKLTRSVVIVGFVAAMTGLAQNLFFGHTIYGFWTPQDGHNPFGPFVNKNHFAGWLLMALPLGAGHLIGRLARSSRPLATDWHGRLLRLSSPTFAKTVLFALALLVMSIALLLTLSRSAIVALALALGLAAMSVARATGMRELTRALTVVAAIVIVPIAWVGVDAIGARFAAPDAASLNGRTDVWTDATRVVRAFPLVGSGLNTYGVISLFYQTADLGHYYDAAHNDYLQLAAEGGLLVALPAMATVALLVVTIRSRMRAVIGQGSEYWIRVGAVTGLIGVGVQEFSEFSLQLPGNAILFSVLCGVALSPPEPARSARSVD